MTPRERRTFLLASAVLLVASLLRAGWDARRGEPLLPPDSAGVRETLLTETREAISESERRSRPLEDGERIDPNRAPEAELDRLPGVGPALALRIVQERESGGAFLRASDMARVRGLGDAAVVRLTPLLDFSLGPPPELRAAGLRGAGSRAAAPGASGAPVSSSPVSESAAVGPRSTGSEAVVDLNRATPEELETLRGIGPALAGRIVELRGRKGGFRRVEELMEVRGVGPSTLENIRSRVRVSP